jgi:hypothetical protein
MDIFSAAELEAFNKHGNQLRQEQRGDQAAFYLVKGN